MLSSGTIGSRAGRRAPHALVLTAAVAAAGGAGAVGTAVACHHHHHAGAALRVEHRRVAPGGTLVLRGKGFPHRVHVVLRVGRPHHRARRVGGARTGLRGTFVAPIAIERGAHRGRYVAVACHDRCRVRARIHFRIVRR